MSSGGIHHGRVLFLVVMICQVMRWGGVFSLKENSTTCTMPSSFYKSHVEYSDASLATWMMILSSYDWNLLLLKTTPSCQLQLFYAHSEINVQPLVVPHWMAATLGRNIAKGTTDPRVEFIFPKSYRKFKLKSWSNFIFRILTKHQLEIPTKHQHFH